MASKADVNSKKATRKFDIGSALVVGAAAFQAYQFGRALNVYDPEGWSIQGVNVGGLILGVIVNVIVALAATKLPLITAAAIKTDGKLDKKAKVRSDRKLMKAATQARFAQIAFYLLLTLSPFLVAPAWFILWSGLPLPPVLIWFLCVGWAMAPDLGIALGGFVEGKSLVRLSSDAPAKTSVAASDAQRPSATLKSRSAKKSATPSDAPAKIYQCECGEKFVDRFKYSGHTRACATRKEIITSKDLTPVEIPTSKKVEQ